MKGVVLEVRDGYSAILLEDGTVVKRPTTYGIGETVEIGAPVIGMPKRSRLAKIAAAVAAFTLVFTGGGTYAYLDATAMSQVSLDVNPSLEYELNHFDKIVSVRDENDDAKEVVDLLNEEGVKGDTLTEALAKTEDILKDLGYLAEEDDPYILVSVCSGNKNKYDVLTDEIERQLSSDSYNVTVLAISEENKKEADELGLSGGRYAIMKSDEEKLTTAKADEEEREAAPPAVQEPIEYYKTSAVRTLIEGITEESESITIDDDDTVIAEVAEETGEETTSDEVTSGKSADVSADKPQDADASSTEETGKPAVSEQPDDSAEASETSGEDETTSGEESGDTKDTEKTQTEVPAEPADDKKQPAGQDAGVTVDNSGETVYSTEEEVEETVTSGDDEVDGDAPIDMSKLG